jgi:hypothetical protein
MMIEDVVCPVEHLADMTADLIQLMKDHGYSDASAVGHALEGNLHLVFAQVLSYCWHIDVLSLATQLLTRLWICFLQGHSKQRKQLLR